MVKHKIKHKAHAFGHFLSGMIIPNIGAFITWGLLTAIFIPSGWYPNHWLATMIGPMLYYLLPLLIGYSGGKLVAGERGAIIGAIATLGIIAGTNIPMFIGAMIVGPVSAYVLRCFDQMVKGRIKRGFEMLVNNFSLGIIGLICGLIAFVIIGPVVAVFSDLIFVLVESFIQASILPLIAFIIEPAKVLFLNNAVNHGIFTPLGAIQSEEFGRSIFFLIEANPGPALGLLLAYSFLGQGSAKRTAPGAIVIQFFGGIHEIYFPYVLINPKLLLGMILGSMTSIFVLMTFNAGLVGPASPGSIFSVLMMSAPDSMLGVLLAVILGAIVSFLISAVILLKQQQKEQWFKDGVKPQGEEFPIVKMPARVQLELIDFSKIKKIAIVRLAEFGSSALDIKLLKRKIGLTDLSVELIEDDLKHMPKDTDLIISDNSCAEEAIELFPFAQHLCITNSSDQYFYDELIHKMQLGMGIKSEFFGNDNASGRQQDDDGSPKSFYGMTKDNVFLNQPAQSKQAIIEFCGQKLVEHGYVDPLYIASMIEREEMMSTYIGEFIAVPHGTTESRKQVKQNGIVFCQFTTGVEWGDENAPNLVYLVFCLAAKESDHIEIISDLTELLDNDEVIRALKTTQDPQEVLQILSGQTDGYF